VKSLDEVKRDFGTAKNLRGPDRKTAVDRVVADVQRI
jgi:hypothetical protein